MAKWADYYISQVRYNPTGHIDYVTVSAELDGKKLVDSSVLTRTEILDALKSGTTFVTIYMENNKWQKGASLKRIKVDKNYYIKIIPDNTNKDNLGKLKVLISVGRIHGK